MQQKHEYKYTLRYKVPLRVVGLKYRGGRKLKTGKKRGGKNMKTN